MNKMYLNTLGLAYRANKCLDGEELVIQSIQSKQAQLIILASDIGSRSKKTIKDKCNFYKVPYVFAEDRDTLGHAIGKTGRVALSIIDKGFAENIKSYFT